MLNLQKVLSPNNQPLLATNPAHKQLARTLITLRQLGTRNTFLGRLLYGITHDRRAQQAVLTAHNAAERVDAFDGLFLVKQARAVLSSQGVQMETNRGEWACERCTFLNFADSAFCNVCDFKPPLADTDKKRKRVEGAGGDAKVIVLDDDESPRKPERTREGDENAGPEAGSSLLHQLHLERLARQQKGSKESAQSSGGVNRVKGSTERAGSSTFSRPDLEAVPAHARSLSTQAEQAGTSQQLNGKRPTNVRSLSEQASTSQQPNEKRPAHARNLSTQAEQAGNPQQVGDLVILSYNVWFNESVQLQRRMAAIGDLIERHSPHVIFFQEVTPNIYSIFRRSSWWTRLGYRCSLEPAQIDRQYFAMMVSRLPVSRFRHEPFHNSVMGRDLVTAKASAGDNLELTLATTHLESPTGRDQLFSEPRVAQARIALQKLSGERNVIFGGDMNWNDDRDGQVPLPEGWVDPWVELHKTQPGYTYDSVLNQMLTGNLKGRLDRFFCRLADFSATSIEMVGKDPIPGLTYEKPGWGKYGKPKTLPVLPSDHFGLLLRLARKAR